MVHHASVAALASFLASSSTANLGPRSRSNALMSLSTWSKSSKSPGKSSSTAVLIVASSCARHPTLSDRSGGSRSGRSPRRSPCPCCPPWFEPIVESRRRIAPAGRPALPTSVGSRCRRDPASRRGRWRVSNRRDSTISGTQEARRPARRRRVRRGRSGSTATAGPHDRLRRRRGSSSDRRRLPGI